jgi:hypothetical protein
MSLCPAVLRVPRAASEACIRTLVAGVLCPECKDASKTLRLITCRTTSCCTAGEDTGASTELFIICVMCSIKSVVLVLSEAVVESVLGEMSVRRAGTGFATPALGRLDEEEEALAARGAGAPARLLPPDLVEATLMEVFRGAVDLGLLPLSCRVCCGRSVREMRATSAAEGSLPCCIVCTGAAAAILEVSVARRSAKSSL